MSVADANRRSRGDFSDEAAAYAVARPSYPSAIVDRLVRRAGVTSTSVIVDLGAGTGRFTECLAGRGQRVIAVEPSAAMRAGSPRLADVEWRDGTFEFTGLPDDVADWVVAAQAFHWATLPQALVEVERIIAPRGVFTVLWNVRDEQRSSIVAWTHREIDRRVGHFDEGYRQRDWSAVLTSTGTFGRVDIDEVSHCVTMDRSRYLTLWRSHHLLRQAIGAHGVDELANEIALRLERDNLASIDVWYRCRAWTASR